MIRKHEDELICDLAEYYHIHDYRSHEVFYIATLTAGLPEGSRTMKELTGQRYGAESRLLALIVDLMQMQAWVRGGKRGTEPRSLFRAMTDTVTEEFGFDSPEEFEAARQRVIRADEEQ